MTLSTNEKIQEAINSLKIIDDKFTTMHDQASEVRGCLNKLICEAIEKDKYLEGTVWIYDDYYDRLEYKGNISNNPKMQDLWKFCTHGYHDVIKFDFFEIKFNDFRVTINLNYKPETLSKITELGIIVDKKNINEKLQDLESKISILKSRSKIL